MKNKSKTKKILFSCLGLTAAIGIGTAIAIPVTNKQSTSINQQTSNGSSTTFSNTKTEANISISKTTNADGVETYKMVIEQTNATEGTVSIVDKTGAKVSSIEFVPGETIKFEFTPNKGYERYTVREFNITGATPNHFVPTKNDPENKNMFIAKMPTYDETVDKMTGKSWLYAPGVQITVKPSFIIENIGINGSNVNWQHGVFFESLNGYAFSFDKDMKWSEIEQKYMTFENKNTDRPIDLYFFLNGHTLTIDKNISPEEVNKFAPNGWNLLFYNNGTDSKGENGYGTITIDPNMSEETTGHFRVNSIITLSRSINFRMVPRTDGIQFLNFHKDYPGLVGTQWSSPTNPAKAENWK